MIETGTKKTGIERFYDKLYDRVDMHKVLLKFTDELIRVYGCDEKGQCFLTEKEIDALKQRSPHRLMKILREARSQAAVPSTATSAVVTASADTSAGATSGDTTPPYGTELEYANYVGWTYYPLLAIDGYESNGPGPEDDAPKDEWSITAPDGKTTKA